ncbi:hypothetical protein, partial [Salmonella sp. SAL4359]|uniref:hypothetical protein n=1 Tax=Salmonella sp. SAL4359 TaxID=3159880 RepID=UPI00397A4289
PNALAWLSRRPGTLVLRTFSKISGLAGVRIGLVKLGGDLPGAMLDPTDELAQSNRLELSTMGAGAQRIARLPIGLDLFLGAAQCRLATRQVVHRLRGKQLLCAQFAL